MLGRRLLGHAAVGRVLPAAGLCALLALAAGCIPVTPEPPPPPTTPPPPPVAPVTNLALAAGPPATDGQYVAFLVSEARQGVDLNADGDTNDNVLHVWSRATGVTTNVGLATGPGAPLVSQGAVAFTVSESGQGIDCNGDGDTNDNVARIWFGATGTTHNLGLAAHDLAFDQGVLAFLTPETGFGVDLNADGDTNDDVVQVWKATTDTVANLSFAASGPPLVSDRYVAFAVPESGQHLDLDNDTLLNSDVPVIYNVDDFVLKSSALPLSFPTLSLGGSVLGFISGPSMRAYNYNDSATPTNLGAVSAPTAGVGGGLLAFIDGTGHYQVWSAATNTTTPLGLAAAGPPVTPVAKGGLVALVVSEADQGADLDGDGDMNDNVLELYSGAAHTTTNLGLAVPATHLGFFADPIIGDGGIVAALAESGPTSAPTVRAWTSATGNRSSGVAGGGERFPPGGFTSFFDLHAAGNLVTFVGDDGNARVWNVTSGAVALLGRVDGAAPFTPVVADGLIALLASEADQNADLNHDGDKTDDVVQVYVP